MKTASKAEQRNKQKESPKMERQGNNLQSKAMEDSPLKGLNEMKQANFQICYSKEW